MISGEPPLQFLPQSRFTSTFTLRPKVTTSRWQEVKNILKEIWTQGRIWWGLWAPASRWLKGRHKKRETENRKGKKARKRKKEEREGREGKNERNKGKWRETKTRERSPSKLHGRYIDGGEGDILQLFSRAPKLINQCPPPLCTTSWIRSWKEAI